MVPPTCSAGWWKTKGIEPHIPVFDKSERKDGAYPATDFVYDDEADAYRCPGGKVLKPYWRNISRRPAGVRQRTASKKYFARKQDCACLPAEAPMHTHSGHPKDRPIAA